MQDTLEKQLDDIFHHLHQNPEISWEEHQTTKNIENLFKDQNCKVTRFQQSTGLVVEVGQGKHVVALRVDIYALWQEVN
ncbi:hypothetical protein RZN22_01820 [Bacillaceae bacterium S4-13-58]